MRCSTRTRRRVSDRRHPRGLLDTSVVLALDRLSADQLPQEAAIAAITLAELVAGPLATDDPLERARRQERLQRVEATLEPLAFDVWAARAYGRVYASQLAAGRKTRGGRAVDLLIAATAIGAELPLYTLNAADFAGVEGLEVVALG